MTTASHAAFSLCFQYGVEKMDGTVAQEKGAEKLAGTGEPRREKRETKTRRTGRKHVCYEYGVRSTSIKNYAFNAC